MDTTFALATGPQWLDPMYLLSGSGPFGDFILGGIFLVVFIESGVLFPVLPGDSLLFTGGMLSVQPDPFAPLWILLIAIPIAGFLGGQVGYFIGHKFGEHLENRPDGRFWKKEWLTQSQEFFEKYGPVTVIICRFVPIVRTFAAIVAGMSRMKLRLFTLFNIIGALIWGCGLVLLGAWLGQYDFIRDQIEPIFLLIVYVSIVPGFIGAAKKEGTSRIMIVWLCGLVILGAMLSPAGLPRTIIGAIALIVAVIAIAPIMWKIVKGSTPSENNSSPRVK